MKEQLISHQDIQSLGTILTIWAHPDDETWFSAGIMAAAVANGQEVVCVTATKGEAGSLDLLKWPADTLGKVRSEELTQALAVIGVKKHYWMGYKDGCCQDVRTEEISQKLRTFIEKFKPDTILTFGPDGMTGHPDHKSISRWVDTALQQATVRAKVYHAVVTPRQYEDYLKKIDAKMNVFFNIDRPPIIKDTDCNILFHCTESLCDVKREAIAAMPSQMEDLFKNFDREFIDKAFATEAFVRRDDSITE